MITPSTDAKRRAFTLVPWTTDFLGELARLILHDTGQQPGKALVIFPHARAGRYLTHFLQHAPGMPRPCIVPRILTVSETFSLLRAELDPLAAFPATASLPDQIALLGACARETAEPDSELCTRLAQMDDAAFFPWGARLAELMDECFMQGLEPVDISHAEGEVAPFGAALLGSLRRLFQGYQTALLHHELTTPGFDAFRVQTLLQDAPSFMDGYQIYVAGFNTLTATEEALFRHLWERGARICLHGDAALCTHPEAVHWSCGHLRQWMKRFGTVCELACPSADLTDAGLAHPRLHFFAGYDLHSQLDALKTDMAAAKASPGSAHGSVFDGDMAVVLPHSDALLPVLHQLPEKDCNISMGYPLERSQVFQLVDIIMELRALADTFSALPLPGAAGSEIDQGGQPCAAPLVHWRPLLELVRHPLIRALSLNGQRLRPVLDRMERLTRQGTRYTDPCLLAASALQLTNPQTFSPQPRSEQEEAPAQASSEQARLLSWILWDTVTAWRAVRTPADMGNALTHLCETLLACGASNGIWKRFPLDAESLFRIMQRVAPTLRDNLMALTPLPWNLLRAMLHALLEAERVPFEADPLTGLQVIGMLETRLLRFRKVFILDATDDRLPGAPSHSPLLPDSLRAVLGLPDTRHRDDVAAYTFHRLLAGAEDVFLYWQEGVETSGLFDGKKQRSRFIEALIWQEERQRGAVCRLGTPPLRAASPKLVPPRHDRRVIERTPAMDDRLRALLGKPLFATAVDVYLSCPLRFYYEYLCRLRPVEDVNEDDDPAAVGTVLHNTLKRFYEPFVGHTVTRDDLDFARLTELFHEEVGLSGLLTALPPESATMLQIAGPERLRRYLRQQPETTFIQHLEKSFEAPLTFLGEQLRLAGVLDRVDLRGGMPLILDYKTGRLKTVPRSFWEADLWPLIERGAEQADATLFGDPEMDPLPELARLLPSIQLPWYIHVYTQAGGTPMADAAFVELAVDGREVSLLGRDGHNMPTGRGARAPTSGGATDHDELAEKETEWRNHVISQRIPVLLRFLAGHMLTSPFFRPRESRACDWCLWKNLCMI